MNVQSQLGSGTTFSFTANLQVSSRPAATQVARSRTELRGLRTLVVDDNETNRRILAKTLENWGMDPVVVDSASRGLQALHESLDGQPIGLVLSDVNMPEMDGFMLAEEMMSHESLKNTPIILLTSANRSGDGVRCRELGIKAHLIKPARQSFLFDAITASVGTSVVTGASDERSIAGTAEPGDDSRQGLLDELDGDREFLSGNELRAR